MTDIKKERIQYLGFDDRWFAVIGIVLLSFVTDYLFSNSFMRGLSWVEAVISWSVSLFYSTCDWIIMRKWLIFLRKRYPSLKDNVKRVLIFFLGIVVTVIMVDILGGLLLSWVFGIHFNPIARSKIVVPVILISTMTMAIYEAIYFFIRLKKSIREEEQAKQVAVQAQLDTLRNQAQPHFLFNSLNTLRDIIDQNSKDEAKNFVDKLADVYRFILESGTAHLIPLKDEIKFAKAYIHIQSERFGDNLQVNWKKLEESTNAMIVPMSLQLLLENAIKHNVISKAKPLLITVELNDSYLVVKNLIQPRSTQLPSTKLGLKNIQKRYALISKKSVVITKENEEFRVSLPFLEISDQKNNYADTNH